MNRDDVIDGFERHVSMRVNGRVWSATIPTRWSLADLLRDEFGLTGTHVGCEQGVCGACTVRVNGEIVRACLLLAVQVDGAQVQTIEGVSDGDGELSPVQAAFREHHGLQCGFCTPGMVITAIDLLERNPDPTEREIREAMGGNICRCTGYEFIVRSIEAAARALEAAR